jgi:PTS system nitrogen regulatory IIA component
MPYRNMTLEDLARHIGMDVREVYKLAERGRLPGRKVGGQWRVNRAQVTEWLQQEAHTLTDQQLVNLERAMGDGARDDEEMIVSNRLGLEAIDMHMNAKTKPSVLRYLVEMVDGTGMLYDKEGLLDSVVERESLGSTALPNGLAIPHPRQPMPYATVEPLLCLGRVQAGVYFDARGGGLTDLFVLICSHDDRSHLQVLARLMRMFDDELLTDLRSTEEPETALNMILSKEEQVVAKLKNTS